MTEIEKGRPGQFFEDFLKEQGDYEETTEQAVKRVLAWQLSEAMNSKVSVKWKWPDACQQAVPSWTGCWTQKRTRNSKSPLPCRTGGRDVL